MTLSLQRLRDIIDKDMDERNRYVQRAAAWEKMYFGQQFERTARQSVEQEGKEQVVLQTAFNTVHLGMRLISDVPRISVPSCEATSDSDSYALKRKKWLLAMWQRVNAQQQQNVIGTLKWLTLVRGRHCVEVKWVQDAMPEMARKTKFPILIRPLDPFNVGVIRGPYWTDFAYIHEENVPRWKIRQQFPKVKFGEKRARALRNKEEEDIECEVFDVWWVDHDTGRVWNAVIVDDEFAKKPVETDYPEVPIIEGYGDMTMALDSSLRGLSILYPIEGSWEYLNRLMSQMATALLWYFWPHIMVTNESGAVSESTVVRPGVTKVYPAGTNIQLIQMNPNVPLAQNVMNQIDQVQQQSTFPGVMYGQAPGELQAGYGVNLLSQAASGRTTQFRTNLEMTIEAVNRIALAMVQQFGGKNGVAAWGLDDADGLYEVSLKPDEVEDFFENDVLLSSETFQDEIAKISVLIQMYNAKLISGETLRAQLPTNFKIPTDEQRRIEVETLMMSEEMKQKTQADAAIAYFPNTWDVIVAGTPLEPLATQIAERIGLIEPPPPPPPAPPMGPMQQPGPMQGPGPMQQQMMMQPPALPMPQGGGIPPEAQGQFTPEQAGLPYNLPPEQWAQMMGRPMPDGEMLRMMAERGG